MPTEAQSTLSTSIQALNQLDTISKVIKTEHAKYSTDFQTPPEVCKYMVSLLPEGVKTVLEPTPGIGNIVRELKGYEVTAADDYFLLDDRRFDAVVMNPPFALKYTDVTNAKPHQINSGMKMGYQIFFECLRRSDCVIALMPWFTISDSDVRLKTIKGYGLKSITVLPRKTFKYARVQTAVLEMRKGYQGETNFRFLGYHKEKLQLF